MTSIPYLDFDLRIEHADEGYRAQIIASPTGQASQAFTLPFSDEELENFLVLAGRPRQVTRGGEATDETAVQAFGGRLFETLFENQIRDGLQGSLNEAERQGKGLRIRLWLNDAPELADIPWEYLYRADTDRFLALSANTPVVRYLELPGLIHPLTVTPPLRVLAVFASPSDIPTLDNKTEWKRLQTALQAPALRGLVTLDRLNHATLATLQAKLRKADYHIFHFIGHGSFDEQTQEGVLILEDADGHSCRTSGRDLGVLLPDCRTLRLVLLNACEGGRSGRNNVFVGVAQTLVRQGIPAVIAMQFPVTDQAAIVLANAFYGAIADGYPVDAALAEARKQIFTAGDNLQWGTPVLYLRTPDGQIFDIAAAPSAAPLPAAAPMPSPVATTGENPPAATIAPAADAQAAAAPDAFAVTAPVQPAIPQANPSEWHEIILLDRHAGAVNRVTFSPDGKWTVTTGGDHTARVWDTAAGKQVTVLRDPDHTETCAAFSPDGALLATAGTYIRLWQAGTWQPVDMRGTQLGDAESKFPSLSIVRFSPDGTLLATAASASLIVWTMGTWAMTIQLGNPAGINDIAFSPDGAHIVTALQDNTARVWDAKISDTVAVLRGHTGPVTSVAYSQDGRLIVTAGSSDKTARIWDISTEQTLLALNGHRGSVHNAVFSLDNKQILTASDDGTAQIWDANTGASLVVLRSPRLLDAAFSPDGARIITTGADGAARVWARNEVNL